MRSPIVAYSVDVAGLQHTEEVVVERPIEVHITVIIFAVGRMLAAGEPH